jgi:hypothetical protein
MTVKDISKNKRKAKAKDTITPGPSVTQTKEAADKEQRREFYKASSRRTARISEQVARITRLRARVSRSTLTAATSCPSVSRTASSRSGRS